MNEDNMAGLVAGVIGVLVFVLLFGWLQSASAARKAATIVTACGECDHVGECGDYECRPGVEGWQLKAGAR